MQIQKYHSAVSGLPTTRVGSARTGGRQNQFRHKTVRRGFGCALPVQVVSDDRSTLRFFRHIFTTATKTTSRKTAPIAPQTSSNTTGGAATGRGLAVNWL